MRNRVVNVQQIEVVALRDIRHAGGQSETIRRILEQRIIRDFDFVVVDARNTGVETDRIGVGDEMNLVSAIGQFEAQFGGHDTAAAIGGIAGDADFHAALTGISPLPDGRVQESMPHNSSADIQVEHVAAAFAIVRDGHRLDGRPAADFEIVRHYARAFFQLRFEDGPQFDVGFGQQIHRDADSPTNSPASGGRRR